MASCFAFGIAPGLLVAVVRSFAGQEVGSIAGQTRVKMEARGSGSPTTYQTGPNGIQCLASCPLALSLSSLSVCGPLAAPSQCIAPRTYFSLFCVSPLSSGREKRMSRLEILNSGSLRLDGRLPLELRSLALHISPEAPLLGISTLPGLSLQGPDGSARVQQGLTSVFAAVCGPREAATRSNTLHDRAVVEVDVSMEPWSGKERRKRAKGDRFVRRANLDIEQRE